MAKRRKQVPLSTLIKDKSIYQVVAEDMYQKGKSVEDIAHDLNVYEKEVRKWLENLVN